MPSAARRSAQRDGARLPAGASVPLGSSVSRGRVRLPRLRRLLSLPGAPRSALGDLASRPPGDVDLGRFLASWNALPAQVAIAADAVVPLRLAAWAPTKSRTVSGTNPKTLLAGSASLCVFQRRFYPPISRWVPNDEDWWCWDAQAEYEHGPHPRLLRLRSSCPGRLLRHFDLPCARVGWGPGWDGTRWWVTAEALGACARREMRLPAVLHPERQRGVIFRCHGDDGGLLGYRAPQDVTTPLGADGEASGPVTLALPTPRQLLECLFLCELIAARRGEGMDRESSMLQRAVDCTRIDMDQMMRVLRTSEPRLNSVTDRDLEANVVASLPEWWAAGASSSRNSSPTAEGGRSAGVVCHWPRGHRCRSQSSRRDASTCDSTSTRHAASAWFGSRRRTSHGRALSVCRGLPTPAPFGPPLPRTGSRPTARVGPGDKADALLPRHGPGGLRRRFSIAFVLQQGARGAEKTGHVQTAQHIAQPRTVHVCDEKKTLEARIPLPWVRKRGVKCRQGFRRAASPRAGSKSSRKVS